ncbi:MAG: DUF86 domain-containing protein [Dysgonamonadaceae bacterium]|jgi:uncharacterized protein with HEPN domain|nr:DUF86 domain-containing protein [Dysgonamonadaceae bacterium]
MQRHIKNDLLHLLGILESVGKIGIYTATCFSPDDFYFLNDQLNFNASLNLMAHIGECSNKISDELKAKYGAASWKQVKDFRNRVVHDYAGLNIYIVFDIIKQELPLLQEQIGQIIATELHLSTFDIEEFNVAKSSSYYSHVDFNRILR